MVPAVETQPNALRPKHSNYFAITISLTVHFCIEYTCTIYMLNYTYTCLNKFQHQKSIICPHFQNLNVIRWGIMKIREDNVLLEMYKLFSFFLIL